MKQNEGSKASTPDGGNPKDIICWSMCAASAISMTKQDLPRSFRPVGCADRRALCVLSVALAMDHLGREPKYLSEVL
jgi:hypothetical protein